MKTYDVSLTPDAIDDLNRIYDYIALDKQMPDVAWTYIQRLEQSCRKMELAPVRGQKRDDLRKNLRISPIDKNAIIAFEVDEEAQTVLILNIFYGGQDYETIIRG
jgi:plasmid stabilization system protein ParE